MSLLASGCRKSSASYWWVKEAQKPWLEFVWSCELQVGIGCGGRCYSLKILQGIEIWLWVWGSSSWDRCLDFLFWRHWRCLLFLSQSGGSYKGFGVLWLLVHDSWAVPVRLGQRHSLGRYLAWSLVLVSFATPTVEMMICSMGPAAVLMGRKHSCGFCGENI